MKNIENLAQRLKEARTNACISDRSASECLGIPLSTLLRFEDGSEYPSLRQLPQIATLYNVTSDWLLSGQLPSREMVVVANSAKTSYFDVNRMYTYIGAYCNAGHMIQTMRALSFAKDKHAGQFRKEHDGHPVPYIYHPLLITCQALALGMVEDDLLSACLLHDVCEDCGVAPEDLPVSDTCREAVRLLTKPEGFNKTDQEMEQKYYAGIQSNRISAIVKILDRCQNVSGMASAFDERHMAIYILETENYVYPLIKYVKRAWPEYDNQMFLLKYHLSSVVETIKHYMKLKSEV